MARVERKLRTDELETAQTAPHETCIICGEQQEMGIHIGEKYLCLGCERKIVNTEVENKLYRTYVKKMRQIFFPVRQIKS
ncbi:MAG: csfB [Bacilli bacterium]|nr:csfB [Bacilli bacterium]